MKTPERRFYVARLDLNLKFELQDSFKYPNGTVHELWRSRPHERTFNITDLVDYREGRLVMRDGEDEGSYPGDYEKLKDIFEKSKQAVKGLKK